jgi:hypothetical protein
MGVMVMTEKKERKKREVKQPKGTIIFTNQPSQQAIENLHRYVYEILLDMYNNGKLPFV